MGKNFVLLCTCVISCGFLFSQSDKKSVKTLKNEFQKLTLINDSLLKIQDQYFENLEVKVGEYFLIKDNNQNLNQERVYAKRAHEDIKEKIYKANIEIKNEYDFPSKVTFDSIYKYGMTIPIDVFQFESEIRSLNYFKTSIYTIAYPKKTDKGLLKNNLEIEKKALVEDIDSLTKNIYSIKNVLQYIESFIELRKIEFQWQLASIEYHEKNTTILYSYYNSNFANQPSNNEIIAKANDDFIPFFEYTNWDYKMYGKKSLPRIQPYYTIEGLSFPGGFSKMTSFLLDNILNDDLKKEMLTQSVLSLKLIVNTNGYVVDVIFKENMAINDLLKSELKRIFGLMPSFLLTERNSKMKMVEWDIKIDLK